MTTKDGELHDQDGSFLPFFQTMNVASVPWDPPSNFGTHVQIPSQIFTWPAQQQQRKKKKEKVLGSQLVDK